MKYPNPKCRHLDELSQTFNALANSNRLSIVSHLNARDMNVGELAEAVGLTHSALSQHLAKLKEAGLVQTRKERQMRYYGLTSALTATMLGNSLVQELVLLAL